MYTNLNPRTMGLNHHPFEDLLAAAHKTGFKGIEVPAGAFGTPEAAREAKKRMDSLGMRFGLIMAPCDMYKVDDDTFEKALDTFEEWSWRAALAGCTRAYNHIWPGSNTRDYEENFAWHARRLTAIHAVLRKNGIRYGLEFMGPVTVQKQFKYGFIRSLMGVVALAQAVSRDIGFVFDTIHWYGSGSSRDDLYYAAMHPDKVVNLHLCDANAPRDEQVDTIRAMPLENGIIDAVAVVRLMNEHGYDGPVIIEPMQPTTGRYEGMPLEDAARDAITCLHRVMDLAGAKDQ